MSGFERPRPRETPPPTEKDGTNETERVARRESNHTSKRLEESKRLSEARLAERPEKPTVSDGYGYLAGPREQALAGVEDKQLQAMKERKAPLGQSESEWRQTRNELFRALDKDDVGHTDPDVRLKGTAANFFSRNPKKEFPRNVDEVRQQAEATKGMDPDFSERAYRKAEFSRPGPKPHKHFWDSRYRLGLAPSRSDYDFQISTDEMVQNVERYARENGISRDALISPDGGHYRQEHVFEAHRGLQEWAYSKSMETGRDFHVALFPGEGPAGQEAFDGSDFLVTRPEERK